MPQKKPPYAAVADALSEARTYITEPGYCSRDAIVELIDRILGPIGDALDAPKVAKAPEAAPNLDAMSDAALFAYRKRTAPAEDARFFLRTQGDTVTPEQRATVEGLIARNPQRAVFLRELAAVQQAHRQTRPHVRFDPGEVAAQYARDALAMALAGEAYAPAPNYSPVSEEDRRFRQYWANAMYYAKVALLEEGRAEVRAARAALAQVEATVHKRTEAYATALEVDPEPEPEEEDAPADLELAPQYGTSTVQQRPVDGYEDHYGID